MEPVSIDNEARRFDGTGPYVVKVAGGVGAAVLAVTLAIALVRDAGYGAFVRSYLVSYCFYLSLTLGALFFVILQHLTRSGWSVVVRRLAETVAADVTILAVLFIPIVLGAQGLFAWTQPDLAGHDALLRGKLPYLNLAFFLVRCVIYFAVWIALAWYFRRNSIAQDATGDPGLTRRMESLAGPAMVLYAFTLTFAAIDLIMTLEFDWFSTIFGVYYFAGSLLGFLCVLALAAMALQAAGFVPRAITVEHYHDIGKLIFAFVVFWAYIAYSQYMLIWYGNLPEETMWYFPRQSGGWTWVALALLFGHFVIPFVGMMSRRAKRNKPVLAFWAGWMLVLHWIDVYWLIAPAFSRGSARFGLLDVGCAIGLGGLFIAGAVWIAGRRSLIPERDPRLGESLAFENA
jgi:hypothetical protein